MQTISDIHPSLALIRERSHFSTVLRAHCARHCAGSHVTVVRKTESLSPSPYDLLVRWMLKTHANKHTITDCGKCHKVKEQEARKDSNFEAPT